MFIDVFYPFIKERSKLTPSSSIDEDFDSFCVLYLSKFLQPIFRNYIDLARGELLRRIHYSCEIVEQPNVKKYWRLVLKDYIYSNFKEVLVVEEYRTRLISHINSIVNYMVDVEAENTVNPLPKTIVYIESLDWSNLIHVRDSLISYLYSLHFDHNITNVKKGLLDLQTKLIENTATYWISHIDTLCQLYFLSIMYRNKEKMKKLVLQPRKFEELLWRQMWDPTYEIPDTDILLEVQQNAYTLMQAYFINEFSKWVLWPVVPITVARCLTDNIVEVDEVVKLRNFVWYVCIKVFEDYIRVISQELDPLSTDTLIRSTLVDLDKYLQDKIIYYTLPSALLNTIVEEYTTPETFYYWKRSTERLSNILSKISNQYLSTIDTPYFDKTAFLQLLRSLTLVPQSETSMIYTIEFSLICTCWSLLSETEYRSIATTIWNQYLKPYFSAYTITRSCKPEWVTVTENVLSECLLKVPSRVPTVGYPLDTIRNLYTELISLRELAKLNVSRISQTIRNVFLESVAQSYQATLNISPRFEIIKIVDSIIRENNITLSALQYRILIDALVYLISNDKLDSYDDIRSVVNNDPTLIDFIMSYVAALQNVASEVVSYKKKLVDTFLQKLIIQLESSSQNVDVLVRDVLTQHYPTLEASRRKVRTAPTSIEVYKEYEATLNNTIIEVTKSVYNNLLKPTLESTLTSASLTTLSEDTYTVATPSITSKVRELVVNSVYTNLFSYNTISSYSRQTGVGTLHKLLYNSSSFYNNALTQIHSFFSPAKAIVGSITSVFSTMNSITNTFGSILNLPTTFSHNLTSIINSIAALPSMALSTIGSILNLPNQFIGSIYRSVNMIQDAVSNVLLMVDSLPKAINTLSQQATSFANLLNFTDMNPFVSDLMSAASSFVEDSYPLLGLLCSGGSCDSNSLDVDLRGVSVTPTIDKILKPASDIDSVSRSSLLDAASLPAKLKEGISVFDSYRSTLKSTLRQISESIQPTKFGVSIWEAYKHHQSGGA